MLVDLVLVGLAHVDQHEVAVAVLALLEPVLQRAHRDGGVGGRVRGLLADRAAEGLVVDELGDGRVVAAQRAARVLADAELAVLHLQGVVDHQLADQRLADAGEQLDGLVDLDRADAGAQHAQHAALGARRHHARRRRLGVEAAVAGGVDALRGRPEDRRLAVEAVDRAPDVGLVQEVRRVVDHVARREVVGAVDDQVVVGEDLEHVVVVETLVVHDHVDQRVGLLDGVARRLGLGPADVALPVDDLALEVRLVDLVELRDAERAHTGRGQVEQGGRAEAAGADHEHLGVLQPLLTRHPDVGDDQVTAVAAYLVDGELGCRLHQGREGHCGHIYSSDVGCDHRAQQRRRASCSRPGSVRRARSHDPIRRSRRYRRVGSAA